MFNTSEDGTNVRTSEDEYNQESPKSPYPLVSETNKLPSYLNLATLTKIIEKIIHSQFYDFLHSHDLLSSKQFRFRAKYSTATVWSNFADEVLLNMEQRNFCGAVFFRPD